MAILASLLVLGTDSWSTETKVEVANSLKAARPNETVEVDWKELLQHQPSLTDRKSVV